MTVTFIILACTILLFRHNRPRLFLAPVFRPS